MHPVGGIRFHDIKTAQDKGVFGAWIRYGQSKLANLLYAAELARRYPAITSVPVHPGVVKTDLIGNLGYWSRVMLYMGRLGSLMEPEEGAHNQLWAATKGGGEVRSGVYYGPVGVEGRLVREGGNEKLARELWEWTEEELKGYNA
jgi:NAD(P)-dependent dehydrogenase (short-subunit alcohol dehydrogenase family)